MANGGMGVCLDTSPQARAATGGHVVVYRPDGSDRAAHDHAACREVARRLAALKGYAFAGEHSDCARYSHALYFVPTDTLVGAERARALGIANENDLFGGVVPQ